MQPDESFRDSDREDDDLALVSDIARQFMREAEVLANALEDMGSKAPDGPESLRLFAAMAEYISQFPKAMHKSNGQYQRNPMSAGVVQLFRNSGSLPCHNARARGIEARPCSTYSHRPPRR